MGSKRFNGIVMLLCLGQGVSVTVRDKSIYSPFFFFLKEGNSVLNVAK